MIREEFDKEIEGCYPLLVKVARQHGAVGGSRIARRDLDLEVDDLVQEAFTEAWRKQSTFRGDSAFSTWVIGILKNVIRDRIEEAERHRTEARAARRVGAAERRLSSGLPSLSDTERDVEPEPEGDEVLEPHDEDDGEGEQHAPGIVTITDASGNALRTVEPRPRKTLPDRSHVAAQIIAETQGPAPDGRQEAERQDAQTTVRQAMAELAIPEWWRQALLEHAGGRSWAGIAKEAGKDRKSLEYQARVYMAQIRGHVLTKVGSVGD